VLGTEGGEVVFHKPVVYQPGKRTTDIVEGTYVLKSGGQVSFQVASYDRSKALVIDPTLAYSTYLGGDVQDWSDGIAVDASGNAYVTGVTYSSNFPTTPGGFQTTLGGFGHVFVSKLNAAGSALVYSAYLAGSAWAEAYGIAVDAPGNSYVTGGTDSYDFPTTPDAFQTTFGGVSDAFATKLNAAGSALDYSTYLSASSAEDDFAGGIALDASAHAYVTGTSTNYGVSFTFPTTSGAIQTTFAGTDCAIELCEEGFVTKLNVTGSALLYSTYLGGGEGAAGSGIAVDVSGNAYITTTPGPNSLPLRAPSRPLTAVGTTMPSWRR
jgi:hypothetical protein